MYFVEKNGILYHYFLLRSPYLIWNLKLNKYVTVYEEGRWIF